jgi:hypothetical protein
MISLNPTLHQYSEDGVVLPSVTQILHLAGLIDTSRHQPANAEFGRKVHEVTAALDRGDERVNDPDPRIGHRLVGWWLFRETQEFKVLEIEKVVGGRELGYAGTCDRIVEQNGGKWVVDLKTGSPCAWHQIQLAAYALAVGRPIRRMAVYLKPDCEVRFREFKAESDFEDFRKALRFVVDQQLEVARQAALPRHGFLLGEEILRLGGKDGLKAVNGGSRPLEIRVCR